ncbi:aminotransferase class III-fold pyridoxal phosphate-dependent enzyme [Anaerocolumna sp. AGMB13025]|uniref:aminotransferase class III-fold pyridoxal phosphate-dependent enzyme n=1 Tax=Anaerocolumna sp. AGMB13025 TaxID=3039116 RepID=UPI00241DF62E|nr:aminotransferase class III-fold pyridoxal phosphate-dependent enzyme [Anaerocolumna sp. AGMB13025]WFR57115.1 aminotransferase class III-fold pyridoxal phosphate-dependent enzyme [Anaerocolumna sp. AGMB13025]
MDSAIFKRLKKYLSEFIGINEEKIKADTSIFDLGIDSVLMVAFVDKLNEHFNVSLKLTDLAFTYNSIESLCSYIQEYRDASLITSTTLEACAINNTEPEVVLEYKEKVADSKETFVSKDDYCSSNIIDVINKQNKIMQEMFAKQIDLLGGINVNNKLTSDDNRQTPNTAKTEKKVLKMKSEMKITNSYEGNAIQIDSLTLEQKQFVDDLINRLSTKTSTSKDIAQQYRGCLADLDEIAGFKMLLKELHYQITIDHGKGAYLYDLNGNKFIDIAMGYGTLILGHSPNFVLDAIKAEVDYGMQLGARQRHVGEIAELICLLTGFDRVTFTVTGTEAVMTAMKIARAYTGKNKIAIFTNAYHGHNDATLVSKFRIEDVNSPIAPGIDLNASNEILIFKYNDMEDIKRMLKQEGIAAVLVEPVQSRFPECHPIEFLHELRRVTEENQILLIFDEIITGFRCNVGGAKALFNIEPDIATYGKAIANGMPVGVVAGKEKVMNVVDGGPWRFGDKSYPVIERTFFAGTFFKHPFSMAAIYEILKYYKEHGQEMIESNNQKTDYLRDKLNDIFELNNVPIRVGNFSSLFTFKTTSKNSLVMDIFYYTLLDENVYTWEGRTCFISSAHTYDDIDEIINAVRRTVERMISGGFYEKNEKQLIFREGVPDETYYE